EFRDDPSNDPTTAILRNSAASDLPAGTVWDRRFGTGGEGLGRSACCRAANLVADSASLAARLRRLALPKLLDIRRQYKPRQPGVARDRWAADERRIVARRTAR